MINVGVIGAGQGGTSILETLLSVPEVNLIGVCDANFDTPGIKLAKKNNINVYRNIENLLKLPMKKLVIEVTGSAKVKSILNEKADQQTEILDSNAALLISNIVASREKMITQLENESSKLSNLATEIGGLINETQVSTNTQKEQLNTTLNNLILASKQSKENIEQTNQIVNFIKDIAEQTKMLGLNAAIEAARADINSNGFAVVATEIRKMADETGNSVKQITHFIDELNESIADTLANIETMNEKMQAFNEIQDKSTENLDYVSKQINNLADNLADLSDN